MNTIGAATDRVRNCGLSVGSRGGVVGSGPAARRCLFQLSMGPQCQEFNFGELTQQEIIPALEGVAVSHSMPQLPRSSLPVHILPWSLTMHCFSWLAYSSILCLAARPATQALHTLGLETFCRPGPDRKCEDL